MRGVNLRYVDEMGWSNGHRVLTRLWENGITDTEMGGTWARRAEDNSYDQVALRERNMASKLVTASESLIAYGEFH